jgi:transposase
VEQHLANPAWGDQPVGRPKVISDQYLGRLKELVSGSPRDYGYPFQRWTAQWLKRHLAQETGVEVSDRHINRLLKQMGLSTRQSASSDRPHHLPPSHTNLSSGRPSNHRHQRDCGITIADLTPSGNR